MSGRPDNFSWTYAKTSGSELKVSAEEFTRLQNRINLFRQYKEYSTYPFTTVNVGDTANQKFLFDQLINAIQPMNSSVGSNVTSGVTTFNDSSLFYRISNSLNAIT
jgi:isopropylmalate/homocitrate/citramalate synthase